MRAILRQTCENPQISVAKLFFRKKKIKKDSERTNYLMNCLYLRQKGLYMKKDVFEQQKAFAGEKIPSMSRRMVGHDYQQRQMYMITMAIEGRRPLLGKVVGRSDGQKGTPEEQS